MPRLMERDDVMRTAVNLGSAEEVWSEEYDTESGDIGLHLPYGGSYRVIVLKVTHDSVGRTQRKGGLKIGLMKGKWNAPSEEDDRMMDAEIALKHQKHPDVVKFDGPAAKQAFIATGCRELEMKSDHVVAISDMQPFHHDPIDRMLLAQAKSAGIKIVSHDRQFPQYGDFVIKA